MRRLPLALAALASSVVLVLASPARADEAAPSAGGVAFEKPANFPSLLEKAKASGKPLFLDFATGWCGWCKRLDKDVFSRADVADAMKAYVAAHVDAEEKTEGVGLAERYHVHGFPTLVVVDASGDEIDRIVGYLPAPAFLTEVGRIARGEGTLPALRKQLAAHPDDLATALALAEKEDGADAAAADARYEDIAKRAKAKGDREVEATATLGRLSLRISGRRMAGVRDDLRAFLAGFAGTKVAPRAAELALQLFPHQYKDAAELAPALEAVKAALGDDRSAHARVEVELAKVHHTLTVRALRASAKAAGDDPQLLNEAAWAAYEARVLVHEAVAWAKKAVELSKRDPMIVDTLASLRAAARAWDEAITLEEEVAKTDDKGLRAEATKKLAAWKGAKAGKADDDDDDGEDGDDDGEDDDGDDDAPAAAPKPASAPEAPGAAK
jgi:thioredoxin-related protein